MDSTVAVVEQTNNSVVDTLFSFDPGLAIWTWVVFGLLYFVLRKFAWIPLMDSVKGREQLIIESVENANKIKKELSDISKKQDEILAEAKDKANSIIEEGRKSAESLAQSIAEKAKITADNTMEQTRKQLAVEKNKILKEIKKETANLVLNASQKLIESDIPDDIHKKIIDQDIEKL